MARKREKNAVDDPLASIPNYVKTPDGVFDDIEHYRRVAERITKALAAGRQRKSADAYSGSSLYDGIEIEFSTQYAREDIYLDALASKIVLRAPRKKGEPESSLSARRMFYLQQLLRPVEAMKTIGIAQVYLSLKEEGRRQISRQSRATKNAR